MGHVISIGRAARVDRRGRRRALGRRDLPPDDRRRRLRCDGYAEWRRGEMMTRWLRCRPLLRRQGLLPHRRRRLPRGRLVRRRVERRRRGRVPRAGTNIEPCVSVPYDAKGVVLVPRR